MVWIRRVAMSLSLIIGLVPILAGAWRQAGAATLDLREANAVITVQGVATEQSATLPYHWDRLHAGLSGYATFEVAFTLPEPPSTPYGLYLPRL